MDMVFRTDTANWFKKSYRVREAVSLTIIETSALIARRLFMTAKANLKGPHYSRKKRYKGPKTGQMPIPRVTAQLARSLKMRKVFAGLWMVFSDGQIAAYNKFVHDGTKRTRPRRFIGDVVTVNRATWIKLMHTRMRKAIDEASK